MFETNLVKLASFQNDSIAFRRKFGMCFWRLDFTRRQIHQYLYHCHQFCNDASSAKLIEIMWQNDERFWIFSKHNFPKWPRYVWSILVLTCVPIFFTQNLWTSMNKLSCWLKKYYFQADFIFVITVASKSDIFNSNLISL